MRPRLFWKESGSCWPEAPSSRPRSIVHLLSSLQPFPGIGGPRPLPPAAVPAFSLGHCILPSAALTVIYQQPSPWRCLQRCAAEWANALLSVLIYDRTLISASSLKSVISCDSAAMPKMTAKEHRAKNRGSLAVNEVYLLLTESKEFRMCLDDSINALLEKMEM